MGGGKTNIVASQMLKQNHDAMSSVVCVKRIVVGAVWVVMIIINSLLSLALLDFWGTPNDKPF